MYFTYILKSKKTNTYYYGFTSDLQKRLELHNSGKSKYTKNRRPWILHYFEEFNTKDEAISREIFFKSIDGYRWLKLFNII
ncbi:MAG: GIY-YIG nuclease family protein [Ignavibacteria bacterium]|nr:GIY-YIG nuclease family protein [Ignavibacteria bacterium]